MANFVTIHHLRQLFRGRDIPSHLHTPGILSLSLSARELLHVNTPLFTVKLMVTQKSVKDPLNITLSHTGHSPVQILYGYPLLVCPGSCQGFQ